MIQISRIQLLRDQGKSLREISRITGLHRKTVSRYLASSSDTCLAVRQDKCPKKPIGEESNQSSAGLPVSSTPVTGSRFEALSSYFTWFDKELNRTGVTRQLLWQEYRREHPDGYGYTQFCEYYSRHLSSLPRGAVMHLEDEYGDCLQADFAGTPLHWIDRETGEEISCPVLVCVLAASGFTYVEALASGRGEHLFGALNRCLEYFGGVPKNVLSDNMRQYVVKNSRYEYTFTELADQWSVHYRVNLTAARVRHPRDKPAVEKGVHLAYQRIYAPMRDEEFYSLAALNVRVRQLLDAHNDRVRSHSSGQSRRDIFLGMELPLLKELPATPFVIRNRAKAKVQKNYHVELGQDKHFYSVPYRHIGMQTTLIYDEHQVEVYLGMERIAVHRRNPRQWGYSTRAEHMPASHRHYQRSLGWNREFFTTLATTAGPSSLEVFTRVMDAREFVEQSYNSCVGLKRLMERYGKERFENACKRSLQGGWAGYGVVENILKNNMDKAPEESVQGIIPFHENIRGADAYQ